MKESWCDPDPDDDGSKTLCAARAIILVGTGALISTLTYAVWMRFA